MKAAFEAYPELVCIDATYKLLDLELSTYLMLVEDSNGQSEIVAVCLLVTEDANSMRWMVDTFKKYNMNWKKIRVVMADKDIGERDILKQSIPSASVLICLFHIHYVVLDEKLHVRRWASHLGRELCVWISFRGWRMHLPKHNISSFMISFKKMYPNKWYNISMRVGIQ